MIRFSHNPWSRRFWRPTHKDDWTGCTASGMWVEGLDKGKPKKVRCPDCRKRLKPLEVYCVGGEWVGYRLPRHKPKGKQVQAEPVSPEEAGQYRRVTGGGGASLFRIRRSWKRYGRKRRSG